MNYKSQTTLLEREIYLTPAQAAKILHVSIATLKKSIYQGNIHTYKTPGGHHRIRRADLFDVSASDSSKFSSQTQDCQAFLEMTKGFIDLLELRLKFNRGHSANVAKISMDIARKLKFSNNRLMCLHLSAYLHDVGKFFIDEQVLNKTEIFDVHDHSTIKTHVSLGADFLDSIPALSMCANICRQHHERFDGSGYPYGLKAQEISQEARIIAIAEAFDVLTSPGSYKEKSTLSNALCEITINSGSQFDPQIVSVLNDLYKDKTL